MKNLPLYLLQWVLLSKSPTSLWRALRRPEPLTERFCLSTWQMTRPLSVYRNAEYGADGSGVSGI